MQHIEKISLNIITKTWSYFHLPPCLCWDKVLHHEQEAKDHHLLSIPYSEFFLQLPCYVAARMAATHGLSENWYAWMLIKCKPQKQKIYMLVCISLPSWNRKGNWHYNTYYTGKPLRCLVFFSIFPLGVNFQITSFSLAGINFYVSAKVHNALPRTLNPCGKHSIMSFMASSS